MDWSQLEYALTLASTAAGATTKMAGTVEAVKKLLPAEKKDNGEAARLINTLSGELTAANLMNVQLSDALKQLVKELKKEDEFEKEKARYELVPTSQGDYVYRLRENMANGEPVHYVCPACLKKDRLIIFIQGKGDFKRCQVNNDHLYRFANTPIQVNRRSSDGWV